MVPSLVLAKYGSPHHTILLTGALCEPDFSFAFQEEGGEWSPEAIPPIPPAVTYQPS